jgi:hypothetical protein
MRCGGCGQCYDCRARWFNDMISYCARLEKGVLEMARLNDAGLGERALKLLEAMVTEAGARQLNRPISLL